MMRARGQIRCGDGGLLPIGPPYQSRAVSLLYRIGGVGQGAVGVAQTAARVPEDWHMVPPELLTKT
eukprot:10105574-Lingulodinium_polyedra.AAC.1